MVDHAFKLNNMGRQGFGLVSPEIWIIEGWIIKVLLYGVTLVCVSGTHCMCEITDYITHIQCNTGVCFRYPLYV